MHKEVKSLANIWANRRQVEDRLGVVYVFTEEALQVFAEQCAAKCAAEIDALRAPHGNEQVEYALFLAEKKVREHFGVK